MVVKADPESIVQMGANKFRMTLRGNGTYQEAKAAGIIAGGIFEGKKIAQGSEYINTKTFSVDLYDEENDKWGDEV